MTEKRTCACVADDPVLCMRLRYPEPEDQEWDLREECQCPCHGEIEDNSDDYDDSEECPNG